MEQKSQSSGRLAALLAYICFAASALAIVAIVIGLVGVLIPSCESGRLRGYECDGYTLLLWGGCAPVILGGIPIGILLSAWGWFRGGREWALSILSFFAVLTLSVGILNALTPSENDYSSLPVTKESLNLVFEIITVIYVGGALALPAWKAISVVRMGSMMKFLSSGFLLVAFSLAAILLIAQSFQNLVVTAPYPSADANAQAMAKNTQAAKAAAGTLATTAAMATATAVAQPAASASNAADTAKGSPCQPNGTPIANPNVAALSAVPPAVANWHVILSDSFDHVANGWTVDTYSKSAFTRIDQSIGNGKYCWDLISKFDFALARNLPTMNALSDVAVSVDGRQVSGTPDSACGLVVRDDNFNYYFCEIGDDGTYHFGRGAVGIADRFWGSGKNPAIRQGTVNLLTVVVQGSQLTFFVNGQPVAHRDNLDLKSGSVGPAAELFHSGDHAVFEFGNLGARALSGLCSD